MQKQNNNSGVENEGNAKELNQNLLINKRE